MTCPALSTGVTGVNVAVAVQDPDVQAALRASPIRYGAVGPVYRVGVGSTDFEVAGPCGDAGECTPVPPGVQQLLDVLIAVNTQEVRRSPCREALNL
jgi:hypothetical protein